jgi:uncharacterized membrane protein YvlD (DUF360 family)
MAEWLLNSLELLCVITFIVGIGLIYVPAALIVGGALGVVAFEFLDRRIKMQKAKE